MTPPPNSRDYSVSPLGLLVLWLSHWHVVIGVPLCAALAALAVSFLVQPSYRSRAMFVPESRGSGLPGNLAGLASQFGVSLNSGEPAQSPQFYADLLRTRPVLTAVLLHRYAEPEPGPADSSGRTLLEWFDQGRGARGERRRLEDGLRQLNERTTIAVDRRTNVVTIEVELPSPSLAADVLARYLEYLNEFNLRYRRSQSRARREFVEGQVKEAESTLTVAEDGLRRFYEQNRQWGSSPTLRFEESRLRRRVEIQQELFLSLGRDLEAARISEVNDTPVLTVIEPPVIPARKSSPRRLQWAWLAFALSEITILGGLVLYQHRPDRRDLEPVADEWLTLHAKRFAQLVTRSGAGP